MSYVLDIKQGIPPKAKDDELVCLDSEIFGIPDGKLHRPVGTFACLSVLLGRHFDEWQIASKLDQDYPITVYQITDIADIPGTIHAVKDGKWVFQNGIFDLRQLRRWATIEPRRIWDTKIVDQGLFGGYYSTFDLGSLSIRYLNEFVNKSTREDFIGASEMTPEMQRYAALDTVITMRVALEQMDYVIFNDVSMDHYWLADHPAIWAILDMPAVHIATNEWIELGEMFRARYEEVQNKYSDLNLRSNQQVNRRICELLGKAKLYSSVDADHLAEIRTEAMERNKVAAVEFIDDVISCRKASKMSGTYGAGWADKYVEDGNYINADWKPVEAKTGRMACGDPGLQQVPSREYPIFRTKFTARPDHKIIVADVAQQEPRTLAKLSGDPFLTETLRAGKSPHIAVGQNLFHDPEFSKKDSRYALAKQTNLGTSYGMTAVGLSAKTGFPKEECQAFIDLYFKLMPGVKNYIDRYRKLAYRHEYVKTLTGRRCWVNTYSRKWENNAINGPIQGTAADQMKIAMSYLHRTTRELGLPFCLVMVIHDEMVCDVPNELVDQYTQLIKDAWQEAGRLTLGDTVPMVVEIEIGDNWGCKNG